MGWEVLVTLLNANQSLIDCLASITMNDLMEIWPERLTDYPEDRIVRLVNMQEEYNALLSSREELKPFVEKKMDHFYSTVPEKEAKKYREDKVNFLREHPEALCALAEASRRRKELLK